MNKVWGFAGRHWMLSTFLVMVVGAAAWWHFAFPSGVWRYKMTVTVETPEGLKTGSAVREVTYSNGPKILPDVAGASWKVKGEAVVVDMGQGKHLFALLDVDGSYQIVYDVFPYYGQTSRDHIQYYKSLTGQKKTLEKSQYPTMVTFKDIKDPKTVTSAFRVEPYSVSGQAQFSYKFIDDMGFVFGQGVKLKDVTIEMTDEPVTWKMRSYLGSRQMVGPYLFVKGE